MNRFFKYVVLFFCATISLSSCDKSKKNRVPDDFVLVKGMRVKGQVGDSNVFVEGGNVPIGNLYVCDHEVTQAEFKYTMGYNDSFFDGSKKSLKLSNGTFVNKATSDNELQLSRPVECVSWYEAIVYCNTRSYEENLTPCYIINESRDPDCWEDIPEDDNDMIWDAVKCDWDANGYRLLTKSEWEYCARGGRNLLKKSESDTFSSDNILEYAWLDKNSGNCTHQTRSKKHNALGLYDMVGNVSEWCWDWDGENEASSEYRGPLSGSKRFIGYSSCFLDVVFNNKQSGVFPGSRYVDLGFRVARKAR